MQLLPVMVSRHRNSAVKWTWKVSSSKESCGKDPQSFWCRWKASCPVANKLVISPSSDLWRNNLDTYSNSFLLLTSLFIVLCDIFNKRVMLRDRFSTKGSNGRWKERKAVHCLGYFPCIMLLFNIVLWGRHHCSPWWENGKLVRLSCPCWCLLT